LGVKVEASPFKVGWLTGFVKPYILIRRFNLRKSNEDIDGRPALRHVSHFIIVNIFLIVPNSWDYR